MRRLGPIEAEHLAAPALRRGGHKSPVAWQQAGAGPACLKACGVHRAPTRLGSAGPDWGLIDALQRLRRTEAEASHLPLNMLTTLCTAEHIPIGGSPLMDRRGPPYDRQHRFDPLWDYLL
jgi:hypothetical protein